jgi:hypothetical protein
MFGLMVLMAMVMRRVEFKKNDIYKYTTKNIQIVLK